MQHNFMGLETFKRHLDVADSTLSTADEARMLTLLDTATAMIEQAIGRRFAPYVAVRSQAVNSRCPDEILLDADLQVISALTDGNGDAIELSRVELLFGSLLRLTDGTIFDRGATNTARPVTVSGVWGYCDIWCDSGDVVTGVTLGVSDTVVNVNDADSIDTLGRSPRFQVGQLLRIGAEYVRVSAVDAVNNQMTVLRAQNGSTALAYPPTTPIEIFTPPGHINGLILRVATWLYHAPDERDHSSLPESLWREVFALRRVGVA